MSYQVQKNNLMQDRRLTGGIAPNHQMPFDMINNTSSNKQHHHYMIPSDQISSSQANSPAVFNGSFNQ